MRYDTAKRIGYHEQAFACCAICKHATYGKNHCEKFRDRARMDAPLDVCPTGVCDSFKLRDASQDEEYESNEELY